MPFAENGVLDDFNRADNTTSLGANWLNPIESGYGTLGILTNQAYPLDDFRDGYWLTPFAANQEAFVTIPTLDGGIRLYARLTNPGGASRNCYYIETDSVGGWFLGRIVNGVVSTAFTPSCFGDTGTGGGLASGNKLGIEIIRSTISVYRDTGSGWATAGTNYTTTDTNVPFGGYIGLQARGVATMRWDDFGGGGIRAGVVNMDKSLYPKTKLQSAVPVRY